VRRKKAGRRKDSKKSMDTERGMGAVTRRGKQVSRRTPYFS